MNGVSKPTTISANSNNSCVQVRLVVQKLSYKNKKQWSLPSKKKKRGKNKKPKPERGTAGSRSGDIDNMKDEICCRCGMPSCSSGLGFPLFSSFCLAASTAFSWKNFLLLR
jgi:hypothetical protein